ncbi:hypothetical protein X963_2028 [Burkholderia pseudomallei MSHR7498]|nr:hypothetical protein X963_2028 [Burkholderia pseudomallei MSHR7498]
MVAGGRISFGASPSNRVAFTAPVPRHPFKIEPEAFFCAVDFFPGMSVPYFFVP